MGERVKWGLMTALAFIIVGYTAGLFWMPDLRPTFIRERIADAPLACSGTSLPAPWRWRSVRFN